MVYDGKLFDVTIERWGDHEREIVEHPGAVAIVAVDTDGMVALVRQRREAARKELLELPAGTLEEGEQPLERMHLFAAEGVESGPASPEEDEQLELIRWRVQDVAARLGEIEDAKTLAGLLLYLHETSL